MRMKNWMLGGILAIVAILGPMVAYAGVTVIYPTSTQTAAVDTTPLITFQAGDDHALASTLGFAGAFTQNDNAASFTLTINSLSGGSVTIDNYAEGVADASVGVWGIEVVDALTGTLTNPTSLRIRLWDPAGAAPTSDVSASVCVLFVAPRVAPVRKQPEAPAWFWFQDASRPLTTINCSRKGASGSKMGESSKLLPSPTGVQYCMAMPFGR